MHCCVQPDLPSNRFQAGPYVECSQGGAATAVVGLLCLYRAFEMLDTAWHITLNFQDVLQCLLWGPTLSSLPTTSQQLTEWLVSQPDIRAPVLSA